MKAKINFADAILSRVASRGSRGLATHSVMLKQSLHLGAAATCHAGLAVLMAWYVVARIGVNVESDAFFASTALPQFVFAVLSTTLVPVLVPLLTRRGPLALTYVDLRGNSVTPRGIRRLTSSGALRHLLQVKRARPLQHHL